ncbi:MAG: MBL fold metallo-hydrolase [Planctomycetota bacterium]
MIEFRDPPQDNHLKIHRLKLRLSNAYLIAGEPPVLVDSGSPKETAAIRSQLRRFHVEFSDLALIIHTHVHSDHMGNTAEIIAEAGCPVAYHPADQELADRSNNGPLKGIGLRGRVMSRFLSNAKFDAVPADIPLYDGMSLDEFGIEATIMETPGHTPGSVSVLFPDGDAIVGDILMGGIMGGALLSSKPNFHYFADNIQQAMNSLDRLLSRTSRNLYVGHGGPLAHEDIIAWRQHDGIAEASVMQAPVSE